MNTTAANVAGQAGEKDKEKMEKRRALGRGLASLFSGPRPVPVPTAATAPKPAVVPEPAVMTGHENPRFSQNQGEAGHPSDAAPSVASVPQVGIPHFVRNDSGVGERVEGTITAVVDESASFDSAQDRQPTADVPALAETRAGAPAPHAELVRDEFGNPVTIMAMAEGRIPGNLVVNLAIADIDKNPFQTRYVQDDDALEELAESIKVSGVVQPILVRPSDEDEGRYILIMGERRLHASKKAGKTHIPALVRKVSLQQAAEMTIVENLQREDLSPLEQAEAFRVLSQEFNLTQEEIGQRVGLSRVSIANYMRLLKLPREVMQLLAEKRITFQQAKELLKLGDNDRIAEAALYAVKKGMNIEQIEMLVLRMDGLLDPLSDMPGQQKKKEGGGARWVDPNVRAAQVDLERMLGVRVRIRDRKGKGKIVIEYATVDDYERVVEMLRGRK